MYSVAPSVTRMPAAPWPLEMMFLPSTLKFSEALPLTSMVDTPSRVFFKLMFLRLSVQLRFTTICLVSSVVQVR